MSRKKNLLAAALLAKLSILSAGAQEQKLPALYTAQPELSAQDILAAAYEASGGNSWLRPKTLSMTGYGVFYRNGEATIYDDYRMHRVYARDKDDAHAADGKVRIEAKKQGEQVFVITFDGKKTYNAAGPVEDQSANAQWASNFGFGAIRHGLDEGWTQKRLPDDLVDGKPAFLIELTDPAGGMTRFGVDQKTKHVLYVGFETARGWHERRYSNFFTKSDVDWVQPGRVRLFYDGVKQNEVIWSDFEIDKTLADELFVIDRQ